MQAQAQNQFSNAIVQGDCIDVMRAMPEGSIDFILTDPPYLVNYRDRTYPGSALIARNPLPASAEQGLHQ
jgi:DNA modification methylase